MKSSFILSQKIFWWSNDLHPLTAMISNLISCITLKHLKSLPEQSSCLFQPGLQAHVPFIQTPWLLQSASMSHENTKENINCYHSLTMDFLIDFFRNWKFYLSKQSMRFTWTIFHWIPVIIAFTFSCLTITNSTITAVLYCWTSKVCKIIIKIFQFYSTYFNILLEEMLI